MYAHHTEVYEERFKAFGFYTINVDGHSIKQLVEALENAYSQDKPTALICKTLKGKNFVNKIEGQLNWHGKDLGGEFDATIAHLKSLIKRTNIEFNVTRPEGDDFVHPPPKITITPNYKAGDMVSTRKAYGTALLKAHQSD